MASIPSPSTVPPTSTSNDDLMAVLMAIQQDIVRHNDAITALNKQAKVQQEFNDEIRTNMSETRKLAIRANSEPPKSGTSRSGNAERSRSNTSSESDLPIRNRLNESAESSDELEDERPYLRDILFSMKKRERRNAELTARAIAIPSVSHNLTCAEIEKTVTLVKRLADRYHLDREDCFTVFALKTPDHAKWLSNWRSVNDYDDKSFEDMVEEFLTSARSTAPKRNPHNDALLNCKQSGSLQEYHFEFKKKLEYADKLTLTADWITVIFIHGLKKHIRDAILHVDFDNYQQAYAYLTSETKGWLV